MPLDYRPNEDILSLRSKLFFWRAMFVGLAIIFLLFVITWGADKPEYYFHIMWQVISRPNGYHWNTAPPH